jgi:hypothetical protein
MQQQAAQQQQTAPPAAAPAADAFAAIAQQQQQWHVAAAEHSWLGVSLEALTPTGAEPWKGDDGEASNSVQAPVMVVMCNATCISLCLTPCNGVLQLISSNACFEHHLHTYHAVFCVAVSAGSLVPNYYSPDGTVSEEEDPLSPQTAAIRQSWIAKRRWGCCC